MAPSATSITKKAKKEKVPTEPTRFNPPRSAKPASRAGSPVKRDASPVVEEEPSLDEDPDMSSRRTTRGTSKNPSEVSGVTAATGVSTTTRRRTPRKSGPLPAVGTKTSNAYGTNAVQGASRVQGPEVARQISGVLDDLLEADANTPRRRQQSVEYSNRGSRAGSSAASSAAEQNRTFNNESGVFGEAHIASSRQSPDLSMIEEEFEDRRSDSSQEDYDDRPSRSSEVAAEPTPTPAQRAQEASIAEVARNVRIGRVQPAQRTFGTIIREFKDDIFHRLHVDVSDWKNLLKKAFLTFFALAGVVLLFGMLSQSSSLTWYGFSPSAMRHNVGQLYTSGDLVSLRSRVSAVERDVYQLQRKGKIHEDALHRLESLLPEFIVGTKDKSGKIILPHGLWQAIESKIKSEHPLAFGNIQGGKGATVSANDIENQVSKSFERFVKSNEFKSKAIDSRFAHLIDQAHNNNVVISKADAIDLIRESWETNKASIKAELATFRKDLDHITQTISKLEDGPHSKAEVQQIAKDFFAKMLPDAQLSALSRANQQTNINYGLTRVNHFSRGTGAVINPHHISPNFVFPEMKVNLVGRMFRAFIRNPVPIPNSPIAALTKWEEHGDCWCSPSKDLNGFGPSLAVIMGSNIYPEEVVIEHIKSTASIEPGSAPREMELLAYVPEVDSYIRAKQVSDQLFIEEANSDDVLPKSYVRIATFTYDINSSNNIQAFPVQLDTTLLKAHTNQLIVRAKSNWGGVPYTCMYRVRVHGKILHSPGQS